MTTQDDLAYVREMAEKGAGGPLGGGAILLWWGLIGAAALIAHWAIAAGLMFQVGWSYLTLWFAAVLIGWTGTFVLIGRARAKGGTTTHASRANGAVWMAAGLFLTIFAFAVVARQMTNPLGPHMFDLLVAVGTGVYGIAFATSAAVSGQKWLRLFALVAFAFSALYIFMLGHPQLYLIAAMGTSLTVGLPGVLLMMRRNG